MRVKKFINKHEYPGGKKALHNFINQNLKYPKQAVIKKIEGIVFLSYKINEKSKIIDIKIIKGLGFGCDEEAIRVVSLLNYPKPKNRGIKISSIKKIKISFRLPERERIEVSYKYIPKKGYLIHK